MPRRSEARKARAYFDRLSGRLALPDTVEEEAARICARGLSRSLAVGRPIEQLAVASLYAACRERKVPVTLDELSRVSGQKKKSLAKCYRLLVVELGMELPVVDPVEYVPMVASRARASPFVQAGALEILAKAEKAGVAAGRNPIGVAASALYMASTREGEGMTQRDAAEAAGVTEVTLRNEYQRLRQAL